MEHDICAICLDAYNNNKSLLEKCLHTFCYDCIVEWFSTKKTCPLCLRVNEKILFNIQEDNSYDEYDVNTRITTKAPRIKKPIVRPPEVTVASSSGSRISQPFNEDDKKAIVKYVQEKINRSRSDCHLEFTEDEIAIITSEFDNLELNNADDEAAELNNADDEAAFDEPDEDENVFESISEPEVVLPDHFLSESEDESEPCETQSAEVADVVDEDTTDESEDVEIIEEVADEPPVVELDDSNELNISIEEEVINIQMIQNLIDNIIFRSAVSVSENGLARIANQQAARSESLEEVRNLPNVSSFADDDAERDAWLNDREPEYENTQSDDSDYFITIENTLSSESEENEPVNMDEQDINVINLDETQLDTSSSIIDLTVDSNDHGNNPSEESGSESDSDESESAVDDTNQIDESSGSNFNESDENSSSLNGCENYEFSEDEMHAINNYLLNRISNQPKDIPLYLTDDEINIVMKNWFSSE